VVAFLFLFLHTLLFDRDPLPPVIVNNPFGKQSLLALPHQLLSFPNQIARNKLLFSFPSSTRLHYDLKEINRISPGETSMVHSRICAEIRVICFMLFHANVSNERFPLVSR
jgi:hypothetical protein